jgi:recombinational DNA repair protein (RecF pathway)
MTPPTEILGEAVVLGRGEAGEARWRFSFLHASEGLVMALRRHPGKRGGSSPVPDVFEIGEVQLQASAPGKPYFVRDYRPVQAFRELARRPEAFRLAGVLCAFYRLNLHPSENNALHFETLRAALQAFAHRPRPDATLFKSVYRFASREGFAVREDWAARLQATEAEDARQILSRPLDEIEVSPERTTALMRRLLHFLEETGAFRLPRW